MAANQSGETELVVWQGPAAMHVKIVTHGGMGKLVTTVVMNPAGNMELFVELEQLATAVALAMVVHIVLGITLVFVHVVRWLCLGTTCDMFCSRSSCLGIGI